MPEPDHRSVPDEVEQGVGNVHRLGTLVRGHGRDANSPSLAPGPPRPRHFVPPPAYAPAVQHHRYSLDVNAPPEEVWELFWYRGPDRPQGKIGRIDILHAGDEVGEGLVRHCTFPVPKFLLSGGVGRSWEWLTQVRPYESWRYDAIGKPLWSKAVGHTRLEDLGDGRTRIHFSESYECFNPWMRRVGLEKYVHEKISKDNDTILAAIEGGIRWHRKRRAREAAAREQPSAQPESRAEA